MKNETTKPPSFNFLQQQERFDRFIEVYNDERPHQALGGKYPGQVYTPSNRIYRPADEPEYPYHDKAVRVTKCGRICIGRRKINLSRSLANQTVGIREVADKIWLVSLWNMIWTSLIRKRGGSNQPQTPSSRYRKNCKPCLRYNL